MDKNPIKLIDRYRILVLIVGCILLSMSVNAAWYTFDDCGDIDPVSGNPGWYSHATYDKLTVPLINTSLVKQGSASMELTWNTSNSVETKSIFWSTNDYNTTLDQYKNGSLTVWVYIQDSSILESVWITFGNSIWDDFKGDRFTLSDGWNVLTLDFDTCDSNSGTVNWSAIDTRAIHLIQNTSNLKNGSVIVDDMQLHADDPLIITNRTDYWEINNNHYRLKFEKDYETIYELYQNHDRNLITGVGSVGKRGIYNTEYHSTKNGGNVYSSRCTDCTVETNLLYNSSDLAVLQRYIYENYTNISEYYHFIDQPYIVIKELRHTDSVESHTNFQTYYYINNDIFKSDENIFLMLYNGTRGTNADSGKEEHHYAPAINYGYADEFPYWDAYNSTINVSVGAFYTGMSDDKWLTTSIFCCGESTGWTEPQLNHYAAGDAYSFLMKNTSGTMWTETYIWTDEGQINESLSEESFNSEYGDNITVPSIFSVAPFNITYPGSGIDLTTNSLELHGRVTYFQVYSPTYMRWYDPHENGRIYLRMYNSSGSYNLGGGSGVVSQYQQNYNANSTHAWGNMTWETNNLNVTWHLEASKNSDVAKIKYVITPVQNVSISNISVVLFAQGEGRTAYANLSGRLVTATWNKELLGSEGYSVYSKTDPTNVDFSGSGYKYFFYLNNSADVKYNQSDSWTIELEVFGHKGSITSYDNFSNMDQRVHKYMKYAKTMPGLLNDSFGQIVDQNVIIYNATYNTTHMNLKAYSISGSAQTAYIYTNISQVKYILPNDGIYRIYDRWDISIATGATTEEIDMPWGAWNTSIPHLSSVPSPVEIRKASFDQSADRGNGVVTIQSYSTSDYILGIEMPNATCKYGFRNAKIKDADWDACNFNLSVRGNRVVTITSYYSPGFPTSAIAAFGAGGFAFLVWLWRRGRR